MAVQLVADVAEVPTRDVVAVVVIADVVAEVEELQHIQMGHAQRTSRPRKPLQTDGILLQRLSQNQVLGITLQVPSRRVNGMKQQTARRLQREIGPPLSLPNPSTRYQKSSRRAV